MESDLGCVCTKVMLTDVKRTMYITLQNPNPRKTKCPGVALDYDDGERICYQLSFSESDYLDDMAPADELAMLGRHNEIVLLIMPIMKSLRPNNQLQTISLGDLRLNNEQQMYMPSFYCQEDVRAL